MRVIGSLLFALLALVVFSVATAKDWGKVDMNDIEKEWEDGDDPEELEHEFERIQKIHASKAPKVDMNDGKAITDAYKKDPFMFSGGGGGHMIFVDLHPKQANGKKWKEKDLKNRCTVWSGLIRSAGQMATCYNIGEASIMFQVERAWMTQDIMRFIASQSEVNTFNTNSKTYSKKDFPDLDDDEL